MPIPDANTLTSQAPAVYIKNHHYMVSDPGREGTVINCLKRDEWLAYYELYYVFFSKFAPVFALFREKLLKIKRRLAHTVMVGEVKRQY